MGISAVNEAIAVARKDNTISASEIKVIIAAAKRHVTDDEVAAFKALRSDLFYGRVGHAKDTGIGGIGALLDLSEAVGRYRSLSSDMWETMAAPAIPAQLLVDKLEGKKGFFATIARGFAYLALFASVVVAIGLIPLTAVIGGFRNLYRSIVD